MNHHAGLCLSKNLDVSTAVKFVRFECVHNPPWIVYVVLAVIAVLLGALLGFVVVRRLPLSSRFDFRLR